MSLSEPARSDSPPEARSEPQGVEPSGNLPAPYVSPWQEFGRNLQAMAADLRLRGQELWRRNREGELSVPGFWPRDLAPSFWPLLLVLLLLLPLAGVRFWQDHARPALRPEPVMEQRTSPLELPRAGADPSTTAHAGGAISSAGSCGCGAGLGAIGAGASPPSPNSVSIPCSSCSGQGRPGRTAPFSQARSGAGRLLLELSVDAWQQLSLDQRQSLASSWLQSAFELDYASLQLVNEQGDLLGRSARVGGGMILFDLGLVG